MRYFMTLLCAAVLAACGSEGASGSATQAAHTNVSSQSGEKVYRVLTEEMYEPYIIRRSGGQTGGFEYDILQAVASRENLKLQFTPTDFESMLSGIQNGEADILSAGVVVTPERAAVMDFSEPFINTSTVMVVKADNQNIQTFADIKGQPVSMQSGSFHAQLAQALGGQLMQEANAWLTVNNTLSGRAQATIGDKYVLQYHVNRDSGGHLRLIEDKDQTLSKLAFAVRKGDSELLAKLNSGLAAIRADGTYDQIYERWFGQKPEQSSSAS